MKSIVNNDKFADVINDAISKGTIEMYLDNNIANGHVVISEENTDVDESEITINTDVFEFVINLDETTVYMDEDECGVYYFITLTDGFNLIFTL